MLDRLRAEFVSKDKLIKGRQILRRGVGLYLV